ncbi:MAG: dockerin type I domain-containing protein [Crocinitomicaceae bacterium]
MKILLISGLSALFLFAHTFANAQCQADYNGDGNITAADLGSFLGDYSLGPNCVQCDLNNDGNVNQQDVTLFQGYFGASCATIPPICQADYNSDGVVTASDLTAFLGDLSLGQNCVQCDLNGDGNVNSGDELVLQGVFGIS